MKLIIDVPNEVLKSRHYCQYFGAWSTKLTETIENGIPYEERPQGEWLHNGINVEGMDLYRCSICNRLIVTWSSRIKEYPFCHCGAKMEGGAE